MYAPPHQSQVEDNNIIAAPTPSPSTIEKHINALSTLAKNFRKGKNKGKRNVRDSSLSSFFLQVKNTKNNNQGWYQASNSSQESHGYKCGRLSSTWSKKNKDQILSCKYICEQLFAHKVYKQNHEIIVHPDKANLKINHSCSTLMV